MALATKAKPKSHSRKRQARHHRQSKRYVRAYLPYLPMLTIAGLTIMLNALWSSASVLGISTDFSSVSLLKATNHQRLKAGQPELTIDPQLTAAAQAKANDMARQNYWGHMSPSGQTPWNLLAANGYQYQLAGENLAYGFASAADTVNGWMNSPGHRANVLHSSYVHIGFGVANSPNFQGRGPQTIIVAQYAKPVSGPTGAQTGQPSEAHRSTRPSEPTRSLPTRPVSRAEILTGGNVAWITLAIGIIAGAAASLLVVRHGFRLHRTLARGEAFIMHHPKFDIAVLVIIALGFLLTRTAGMTG